MATQVVTRSRPRKPHRGARVHPAVAGMLGLKALYLFQETPGQTVRAVYPPGLAALDEVPENPAGPVADWTADGPAHNQTFNYWRTLAHHPLLELPGPFTLAWKGTSQGNAVFYGKMLSLGSDAAYTLTSSIAANGFVALRTWIGGSETTAESAVNIYQRRCTVVATYDRQTIRLYVDGAQVATASATGALGLAAGRGLGIAADDTGGNGTPGTYELVLLAEKAWGAGLVREFTANPYGLLFRDELAYTVAGAAQDTPELRGRPFGLHGQSQMHQVLAQ